MDREYAIRLNLHRRAEFLSLSLSLTLFSLSIFERREGEGEGLARNIYYTSPNQRLIFIDSLEMDMGEERRGGGWKFQFDSISGEMDGWTKGRIVTVARILEWPTSSSGWSKISMVVRYQLFEFSLIAYTDRIDWPKSDLSRRKFLDSVSGRENFMEGEYLWRIKVSRKLCSNWSWSFLNI